MRMKTFTKAVALFVVMALMMVMTISAATVTDVGISYDYSTQSVEITATHPEGAAGAGKTVNVVVTDGTNDVYWNDGTVDSNGKVTFEFKMDPATDPSAVYGVEIGGAGLEPNLAGDAETGDTFTFANSTDAADFIRAVEALLAATEDASDAAALRSYLEGNTDNFDGDGNNATQFGIDCRAVVSDYAKLSDASKQEIAAFLVGDYTEDQAGYYAFQDKFDQAVTISFFNDGVVEEVVEGDFVEYYKPVFGFNTSSDSWYAKLSDGQKTVVKNSLLRRTPRFEFDEGAKVLEAFDKATALALYNDLSQATKANLEDYITYTNSKTDLAGEPYTNISLSAYNALKNLVDGSYADMVRDTMADETFTSFADVKAKFDDAVDEAEQAYLDALDDVTPSGPSGPSSSITVTPVAPVVPEKDLFNDLGGVEWAKEAINALAKDGIVNGVAAGRFAPNDVLTREQFVKILVGALDIKAAGNAPFADVIASEWYANFVAIAYNSGIVNGVDANNFGVGQSLTREQLCTMVYRAIKATGTELKMVNSSAAFADSAEISDWAKEAVDYLYRAGVVNGVGANKFDPQGTTTRAMGAKVIYGVLEGGAK